MFAKYVLAAGTSPISSEFHTDLQPGPFQKTKEWLQREMITNPESSFALLVKSFLFIVIYFGIG